VLHTYQHFSGALAASWTQTPNRFSQYVDLKFHTGWLEQKGFSLMKFNQNDLETHTSQFKKELQNSIANRVTKYNGLLTSQGFK
jgi:hypothetical protein